MINIFNKMLREPLVHFLFFGFLLYIYFDMTQKVEKIDVNVVRISLAEKEEIQKTYEKYWDENITTEQLELELDLRLYETVLLKEAYNLELEKQDSEIKKRLLKQMEFILKNAKSFEEPTEEELRAYYKKNRDDYSHLESLSFEYLHFTYRDDEKLLQILKLLDFLDVRKIQTQQKVNSINLDEVKKKFGKYFAHKVENLKKFSWSEVINSKDGFCLVYITDKSVSYPYDFDEVQERVYNDYKKEFIRNVKFEAYKKLSKRYVLK